MELDWRKDGTARFVRSEIEPDAVANLTINEFEKALATMNGLARRVTADPSNQELFDSYEFQKQTVVTMYPNVRSGVGFEGAGADYQNDLLSRVIETELLAYSDDANL